MEKNRNVTRGDIYICNFGANKGSLQNGRRPVIVMQEELFSDKSPTTIVAPLTSIIKKRYLPSHVYLGRKYGLIKPSMVLIEQIKTVNKCDLQEYIGKVTDEEILKRIWSSIKKTFGFWEHNRNLNFGNHMICYHCLGKYVKSGRYVIKRLDRSSRERGLCECCKKELGFKYSFREKHRNCYQKMI